MSTMSENTFLIVGLGNPGREYKENRHNIGFRLVDHLAVRLNVNLTRYQCRALTGDVRRAGVKIMLAKPQTYMNLSGQAVACLVRFYKLPLERVLVVHDDLDLPFGVIRLRPGGGSGGQKGVADVIQKLGTRDFPRLRLGIGRPPGRMDAAAYVLQDFPASDLLTLNEMLTRAADAALTWVDFGLETAMNRYNRIATEGQT
jgi:PTH1 family peptidyl-tRNA hydrolase